MMNLRIHCKQLQMANDSSLKINEKRLLSKLSKFISILKYSVIIKKQIIFIFLFNWYFDDFIPTQLRFDNSIIFSCLKTTTNIFDLPIEELAFKEKSSKICFRHSPERNSYEESWWWFIITFMKIAQFWEPSHKVFHQVFLLDCKLFFQLSSFQMFHYHFFPPGFSFG